MKLRYLVASGLISLLVFMLVSAPASLMRPLLAQQGNIDLGRLDGSIWNGTASHLQIEAYRFDQLSWQLLPSRLLLGKLALDISAEFQQQPVQSRAAVTIGGQVELTDTRASLPAALVAELAAIPMAQLAGTISIDLQSARIDRRSLPQAEGLVQWQQAAVTIADTAQLGDIDIVLSYDQAAYQQAIISNSGGDIALDGNASVEANGDYALELDMLAGNRASDNVKNSLAMFAKPAAGGGYRLRHEGNLHDLAL